MLFGPRRLLFEEPPASESHVTSLAALDALILQLLSRSPSLRVVIIRRMSLRWPTLMHRTEHWQIQPLTASSRAAGTDITVLDLE
jgi:hypothetical protein